MACKTFVCKATSLNATYTLMQLQNDAWQIINWQGHIVWTHEPCDTADVIHAAEFDGFEFE